MNHGRKYYFLKIAETLNITRAAEQLMVSQQSLSQYLTRLERDLEVQLVDRAYTPLRLTEAGRLYYEYLKEEKNREDQFLTELEHLKQKENECLRLGIPLQKRHKGLSKAVLDFCMERPDLDVRVWEGTSSTVREQLIKGELDIGFGHAVEPQDDQCITQVIKEEKIVILCNRNNALAMGRESSPEKTIQIAPETLNEQLFYQMAPEYYLCDVEMEHLRVHDVHPKHRLVMSNLHGIIEAILQNPDSGFAYMPDYVLQEHWPRSVCKDLSFLRLDESDFSWYFCMKRKKGKPLSKNARIFWDRVVKECCDKN